MVSPPPFTGAVHRRIHPADIRHVRCSAQRADSPAAQRSIPWLALTARVRNGYPLAIRMGQLLAIPRLDGANLAAADPLRRSRGRRASRPVSDRACDIRMAAPYDASCDVLADRDRVLRRDGTRPELE